MSRAPPPPVVPALARSSAHVADAWRVNRRIAWTGMAAGAAVGLLFGTWSFGGPVRVPDWIGDYSETSRRLARLGHVSLFGLGILHLLLLAELDRLGARVRARRLAATAMACANVGLPLALLAAAAWNPLKYLTAPPAVAAFVALALVARALLQRDG